MLVGILLGVLLYFPGGARLCANDHKWACQFKPVKIEAPAEAVVVKEEVK